MSENVECPYCGAYQEINHDDGYGYSEDETYQQQCTECEKTFVYTTYILFNYESAKADCLNGKSHKYKPGVTYSKILTKMICEDCGEERRPTVKEFHKILSKEDIINAKKEWPKVKWIQKL